MLIGTFVDDFPLKGIYMSPPDPSEEAAVAGLLGLNSDEKPGAKQPASKRYGTEVASKPGKRSAPTGDGGDSATQTDSVTLTDGANVSGEEVDSGRDDSRQPKRQKSGSKALSKEATEDVGAMPASEGQNTTAPSSAAPFTLANAAQAAGVWNRSAARPNLPKMPTMMSATDATNQHRPSNTGHVTPFEGCDEGAVEKDNVEHADALHRESGADPISHDQEHSLADQQQADLAAFLNESSSRTIPSEALQKLLQQCAAGKQMSITDLFRACQQSTKSAAGAAGDDATHVTHTSTVSTMDIFNATSSDSRAQRNQMPPLSHNKPAGTSPAHPEDRETDGTAAYNDAAPVSANARSLFVQLSDATGDKAALERTATPAVPRAGDSAPQLPLNAGQAASHRTRSSSGGHRNNRPTAQSLTSPLSAHRQAIGQAVPVTSHQKHKSDLLNNPDARSLLWFPEKARNAKGKGKFLNNQKRSADNKQQGLAAERLGTDSSNKSAQGGAQDLAKITTSAEVKTEQTSSQAKASDAFTKSLPITPERVEALLSLVSQLAVFADGGASGTWCKSLHNADCACARSLFRRALELQGKGTTPAHLAPLLTAQANAAAVLAAIASARGSTRLSEALGKGNTIPAGLKVAAVKAAAAAEATQARCGFAPGAVAVTVTTSASTPSKRPIKRRSSAAASAH